MRHKLNKHLDTRSERAWHDAYIGQDVSWNPDDELDWCSQCLRYEHVIEHGVYEATPLRVLLMELVGVMKTEPREIQSVVKDLMDLGLDDNTARDVVRRMLDRGILELDSQMNLVIVTSND